MWSFLFPNSGSRQRLARPREERFRTNLLSTNLGEVVDISATGTRVRGNRRPTLTIGQVIPLTIRSPQCKVVVQCRVVRVSKAPAREGRGTDVSLAFLDAKPALRAAIAHLGRFGFIPHIDFSNSDAESPRKRGRGVLPDYYGLLGVAPGATPGEIRRAYHLLAKQHHPDHVQNTYSVGMFEAVVEAYRVLRDPANRRAYDAARQDSRSAA